MDLWHKTMKWLDHNRYQAVSILLIVGILAWLVGCQPRTPSLRDSAVKVTAPEFFSEVRLAELDLATAQAELDAAVVTHNARVTDLASATEAGQVDLENQYALRRELLTIVGTATTELLAGTFNPAAFVPLAVGLIGGLGWFGATLDNRRKNALLDKRPAPANGTA